MALQAESTLPCMLDGVMVRKRSGPKYRPANGVFFYVQKEPAPKSFYSAIFYWNQAEDEPCLQPPRRTHRGLGATLLGGAEHGGPQQPTAGWKTSVSATH